ncbi:glycosyltransferase [Aeoliella sp.]|uniref:glycosyltransferase n=1 Tax=Aeoliella sp. TaxID=2795800 RepID=UPI003CCBE265
MQPRYLIVTPCRDEAEFLPRTIASVAAQTIQPKKWIIVDDGSTDSTPEILQEAAAQYSFIEVMRCDPSRKRNVGPGVIETFRAGLEQVELAEYDFLCKLDADLEFSPVYFERLLHEFASDPWLGTISGKTYLKDEHGEREEHIGDENSVGAAKLYRRECFEEIGGFVPYVGWDAIDGHMCRLSGWKARSIRDIDVRIHHLRRIGSSQNSFWEGRLRWGRGKYFIGSAWYYVLAASAYRMFEKPYVVSGVGILLGYAEAVWRRHRRFEQEDVRAALRRFERQSLIYGKARTLAGHNRRIERDFPLRGRNGEASQ